MYIAEISPQNLRGGLGSVNQVTVFNGFFVFGLNGGVVFKRLASDFIHDSLISFCFCCVALCHHWNIAGLLAWTFSQLEITSSFG